MSEVFHFFVLFLVLKHFVILFFSWRCWLFISIVPACGAAPSTGSLKIIFWFCFVLFFFLAVFLERAASTFHFYLFAFSVRTDRRTAGFISCSLCFAALKVLYSLPFIKIFGRGLLTSFERQLFGLKVRFDAMASARSVVFTMALFR